MHCAMTGRPIDGYSDGIYDDGEWISWDWINSHLDDQELRREFPHADPEVVRIFQELLELAQAYHLTTGRYLQIWGELGELYGEIHYGIVRHKPGTAGSDGRLGNDFVEVKTISPEKSGHKVQVKRAGNFNKLLVVRISADFEIESRMIPRAELKKGKGAFAHYRWPPGAGDSSE